jgi:hypothetical protein
MSLSCWMAARWRDAPARASRLAALGLRGCLYGWGLGGVLAAAVEEVDVVGDDFEPLTATVGAVPL